MKKPFNFLFFFLLLLSCGLYSGDTGSSFAGGMVGGMMGGMVSGAMTRGSGRSAARRAEERARIAEEKAEAVRREQEREKVETLRREMSQKSVHREKGAARFMMNILLFAVILLFLAVIGLGVLLLRRKKE